MRREFVCLKRKKGLFEQRLYTFFFVALTCRTLFLNEERIKGDDESTDEAECDEERTEEKEEKEKGRAEKSNFKAYLRKKCALLRVIAPCTLHHLLTKIA